MKRRLALLFARRYMRSARSLSVINTTASVSSIATGVAVAAMVVLLSVYNGFESILQGLYTATEADLVIRPTKGKTFDEGLISGEALEAIEGVAAHSAYIQESVVAEYHDREVFATLVGVDDNYPQTVDVGAEGMMKYGEWRLKHGDFRRAVVGCNLDGLFASGYMVQNAATHDPLTILTLRKENISPLLPISALKGAEIRHVGTLSEVATPLADNIFTALDWAQEFLSSEGKISGVTLKIAEGAKAERVQERVQEAVGEGFVVKNRYELNEAVFRATKFEKWSIFFILLLVTIIAGATIISSLVMLVTEKQNDIATLYSVGAKRSFVTRIFRLSGVLIGLRGVVGGIVVGVAVCWAQQHFGLVKMPGGTFLIEDYPVRVLAGDLIGIALAVGTVIWIITNFTISRMIPRGTRPDETRH